MNSSGFATDWKKRAKTVLWNAYLLLLSVLAVGNVYFEKRDTAAILFAILAINILGDVGKSIAEAIRTQRNYHIIGDANNITVPGGQINADHVTVSSRMEH